MQYNYTVHPDSTHDEDEKSLPTKVIATVSLVFPNPAYKEAYDETVETPVMQYEENGEIKRDADGEPVYENEEQVVHHEAEGSKELSFAQDIFITADEKKQDAEVKSYCEQYEKDYVAQFEATK